MNNYQSTLRPTGPSGRSSTSPNPRTIAEEIKKKITTIEPNSYPLITLSNTLLKGPAPTKKVIEVPQYYKRDIWDYASASAAGTGQLVRYGVITVDQISRPYVGGMIYVPQDRLWIEKSRQAVEVVMTENGAIKSYGQELSLPATFVQQDPGASGNVSRALPGQIVVKVVQPNNFIPFAASNFVYLSKTIHEGQDIGITSKQRDIVFDKNFVETKETTLIFTETQTEMYKINKFGINDITWQQEENYKEFKEEIEYNMIFGQKAVDSQSGLPKYSMDGILNVIRTHVSTYDADNITDYETLIQNHMAQSVFRYNTSGKSKMGIAGYQFILNFNNAFREYRRATTVALKGEVGLDIDAYVIPGGYKLMFAHSEVFKTGTSLENWLLTFDTKAAEIQISKNFVTRRYDAPHERSVKFMTEWEGTISFSHEQCHSLLKTY